jgi:pheromone a factor receptor
MCCSVPIGVISVYFSTKGVPLAPWISWAETHYDFGRVAYIPAFFWRGNKAFEVAVELTRWLFPASAFLFFALFGFASEARKHYSKAFWRAMSLFGMKPRTAPKKVSPLPRFVVPLPDDSCLG